MTHKSTVFLALTIFLAGMTAAAPSYGQSQEELEKELTAIIEEINSNYRAIENAKNYAKSATNVFERRAGECAIPSYQEKIKELSKKKAEIERKLGILKSGIDDSYNSAAHQKIRYYEEEGYQNLANAASAEERAYEVLSDGYRSMGNNLGEESRQTSRYRQDRVNALNILSLNMSEDISGTRNSYSPTVLPHISDEVAKGFYLGNDIPIPYEKRDSVIRAYYKNQRTIDSIMAAKAALEDFRMEAFRKRLDKLSDKELEVWAANYTEYSAMSALTGNCYKSPKNPCPDGWQKVDEISLRKIIDDMNDNNCGYHCDLYINEEGKYVLAFAGTDDIKDVLLNWIPGAISKPENITNEFFKLVNAQTPRALETVSRIIERLGPDAGNKLVLAGHSLGGRLASEAAIEYGLPAFTFNTAGISMETRNEIKRGDFDKADNAGKIINITTANDPLTYALEYPWGTVYEFLKVVPALFFPIHITAELDLKTASEIIKESFESLFVYNSTDIGMIGAHIELSESFSGHSIVGLNQSLEHRLQYINKYLADRRSKHKQHQDHA